MGRGLHRVVLLRRLREGGGAHLLVLGLSAAHPVDGDLGVDQRPRGLEDGGVLDVLEVRGEILELALHLHQFIFQARGVALELRGFVLEAAALVFAGLQRMGEAAGLAVQRVDLPVQIDDLAVEVVHFGVQRVDAHMQRLHLMSHGQIVGRHGPAHVELQRQCLLEVAEQRLLVERQFQPRVFAGEQQHRGC
ncbi:hypothetical protein SDC9_94583 [bioreactor metagenome]|uniref:Uncharacterized protein n=1 Tax=bioreactor metagenome TaxID=1076179 RepID=A0A645A473_9ZZZZ